jgi:GrpB-like predicted nucleotidyltransferase (UPF0157 family)
MKKASTRIGNNCVFDCVIECSGHHQNHRMQVFPYSSSPAAFRPYDPAVREVAHRLGSEIRKTDPRLQVEHIGSTSVPGCGGKGIVDLAVLYPDGHLATAKNVLDQLGFQKQDGPEPWPDERPMRVGCIEHNEGFYRIHAHVIALDCTERHELIWFRDSLQHDPLMKQNYENWKRTILAMGIDNSLEYCKAKGTFIEEMLKDRKCEALHPANR